MAAAVLFGNYELLERIAEGGMAEVWRARSRGAAGFEKTVVIKRVLPALMANPDFADLLVREAKIASRLGHANIVQIFDLGEENGAYFIAMEHVDGRDLGAVMAKEHARRSRESVQQLQPGLKLFILGEAAKALDYAHRRRGDDGRPLSIVHRDVSPQNILIGYEGAVKVADFGIARADQSGLGREERQGVLRGKYAYMSPEQARGEPLDRRSDLFALGIVLWELVAGRRLFKTGSAKETLDLVKRAEVPKLELDALGWPKDIAPILEKALAADVEARYQSAGDMFADLSQLLFRMGEAFGESELSDAMASLFPRATDHTPNKLRVDLLLRAQDDATGVSRDADVDGSTPAASDDGAREHTQVAGPASRRVSAERRRIVLLILRKRAGDEDVVDSAIEAFGGVPVLLGGDVVGAAFGVSGGERAAEHAARAALEVRRRAATEGLVRAEPIPPMALALGDARVVGGTHVDADDGLEARARDLLARAGSGEITFEASLAEELVRTFRTGTAPDGGASLIEGYRSRRERDALRMRRRASLVGRSRELRALSGHLVGVGDTSRGHIVAVVGEPGVGKSRLLAELRAVAATDELAFVAGRGYESETERPFGALADLVMDLCGVEDEDTPAERFAKVERVRVLGLAPREVRLFGEMLGLAYPVAKQERAGRPRGIEIILALRKALRALARDRVVVLALEDVHWMDDATRQLLGLLVQGFSRARVLSVMTMRPGTPMPHVPTSLIELAPLDHDATSRLVGTLLGAQAVAPALVKRVHDETAGNPFLIEELLRVWRAKDAVVVQRDAAVLLRDDATEVPDSVRTVCAVRVAALRPEEGEILRIAASFERGSVDLATLSAVHGVPIDVMESSLRRLLTRRLVVPEQGTAPVARPSSLWGGGTDAPPLPERVRVASALLRQAVLEALSPAELRRTHGRVADVLERGVTDARMEELAWHSARATDRRRAPDYLARAADLAVARGDTVTAAGRLADAARLLREDGDEVSGEQATKLGLRAAELALDAADPATAERAVAAIEGSPVLRTDAALRVRTALARTRAAALRGRAPERLAAIESCARDLPFVEDAKLRGAAELALGEALAESGRAHEALVRLRSAVESAASLEKKEHDSELHGAALAALACALARAGQTQEAEQFASRVLALAARLGAGRLRFASLAASAEVLDARRAHVEAAARWVEAAEVATKEGLVLEVGRATLRAALAHYAAHEYEAARVLGHDAERAALAQGRETLMLLAEAVVAAAQDDPTLADVQRVCEAAVSRCPPSEAAVAASLRALAERRASAPTAQATSERAAQLADRAGLQALAQQMRG